MHIDPIASLASVPKGRRFDAWLLTTDFKQRLCLRMLFLTALVQGVCIALLYYGAHLGIFPQGPVHVLGLVGLLNSLGFYIAVRSGWNRRFQEPTLALPQTLVSQSMIAAAYTITGPAHASSIIVLPLVLVFGMFNMRVGQVRFIAAYTIALMGAVMVWKSRTDPLTYPPYLELIYFVLVACVLPAISQLSLQLMSMRARLKRHKAELQRALAHIGELATRDELTGLPNRRRISELLGEHAMRQARGAPDFYVAMVDLDHFKAINDQHGHGVGDDVLRSFSAQARAVLRNTDIISRWGGEEFLLLLPETPPGEPTVGLERLRAQLATLEVSAAAPDLRLGFSAGFARFQKGETTARTIERADRALYDAKAGGRNRTVVL